MYTGILSSELIYTTETLSDQSISHAFLPASFCVSLIEM